MKPLWLIQGFFCQGYSGLGIGFAPIEGAVATRQRTAVPVMFAGTIRHGGNKQTSPLTGRLSDVFGDSELYDVEFLDGDELFFCKRYYQKPGERPRDQVVYRLTKEATGAWWSGEYVVDSKPKPFKGPVRCIITEVTLDSIQADLDTFAKDHGFQDPERIEA